MALLASKPHTEGDKRRWVVKYYKWLDNTATIVTAEVTSGSISCTVEDVLVLGQDVIFFLNGGMLGETFMVTITINDSFENTKTDTISFHVIAA